MGSENVMNTSNMNIRSMSSPSDVCIERRAIFRNVQRLRAIERMLAITSPLFLLVLWQLGAMWQWIDTRFFPAPTTIFTAAWDLAFSGQLAHHIVISLSRIGIGFCIGAVPAIVLGIAIGLNRYCRAMCQPLIDSVYPIPKIAILPLILLIFGLGESSKYAVIAVGVFFQVVITTAAGIASIEKVYFDVAKSFGASHLTVVTSVLLPGSLPVIFAGMRLGIGTALLLVVAAEMVAAKSGIGFLIWQSWQMFAVEEMYVGLLVIALLGLVIFRLLDMLEGRLLSWKPKIS